MIFKKTLKKLLKNNKLFFFLITSLIYCYLRICYITSRWKYVFSEDFDNNSFKSTKSLLIVMWHCNIAYAFKIFTGHNKIRALISTHSDGRLVSKISSMC
mgnify:CR=1 FL=1